MTIPVRWIAVPAVVETWNPHEAHPRRLDIVGEPAATRPWRVRDAGGGNRPSGDVKGHSARYASLASSAAKRRCNSSGVRGTHLPSVRRTPTAPARPNRACSTHPPSAQRVIAAGRNAR